MDLNRATLIGRLTRDPETRTTPTGQTVATFSIATGFQWKDQQGNKQERTEFHNIVAWRRLAEICAQYLRKGKQVYIEGRLQTRSWDDPTGVKKYRTEIVAENMIMLGSPTGSATGAPSTPPVFAQAGPEVSAAAPAPAEDEIRVEDIPF